MKLNRLVSGLKGEGGKIGGLLFADDFVGVTVSEGRLQELMNVVLGVEGYCNIMLYFSVKLCPVFRVHDRWNGCYGCCMSY